MVSAQKSREAAYFGSLALGAPIIQQIVSHLFPGAKSVPELLEFRKLRTKLISGLSHKHKEQLRKLPNFFDPASQQENVQRKISRILKANHYDQVQAGYISINDADPKDTQVQKFASSSHKCSKALFYINIKHDPNPPSNQEAIDYALLAINIDPPLPNICPFSGKQSPSNNSSLSHAIANGISVNSAAGKVLKVATLRALNILGIVPKIKAEPAYIDQLGWTPKKQLPDLKRGDALIDFKGKEVIIDFTLCNSFNTAKRNRNKRGFNASQKERKKIVDIKKDFDFPAGGFIPMGFEGLGAWGDSAYELLRYQFDEVKDADPYIWNYAAQAISKGLCKSTTMYLDNIRRGHHNQGAAEEED